MLRRGCGSQGRGSAGNSLVLLLHRHLLLLRLYLPCCQRPLGHASCDLCLGVFHHWLLWLQLFSLLQLLPRFGRRLWLRLSWLRAGWLKPECWQTSQMLMLLRLWLMLRLRWSRDYTLLYLSPGCYGRRRC